MRPSRTTMKPIWSGMLRCLWAGVLSSSLGSQAVATIIGVSGTVTGVDDALRPVFVEGQTYSARYSFDADATPTEVEFDGGARARYAGVLEFLEFSIGTYQASTAGMAPADNEILVSNDFRGVDVYQVESEDLGMAMDVNGLLPLFMRVVMLVDVSQQALTDESLPRQLSLDDWDSADWELHFEPIPPDQIGPAVRGMITGITCLADCQASPLDAPASIWLLAAGALGVPLRARGRRQNSLPNLVLDES